MATHRIQFWHRYLNMHVSIHAVSTPLKTELLANLNDIALFYQRLLSLLYLETDIPDRYTIREPHTHISPH